MADILGSVGRGGRNRRADVRTVQRLLNRHLDTLGRRHPLEVDGIAGPETVRAITRFQQRAVGMLQPDGRVDPGGHTLATLNREVLGLVLLPARGEGYYAYSKSAKRYGTRATVRSVEAVARAFHDALGIEVGVGNISRKHGGKLPPHRSHRRGVDVDFRPLRTDGKALPVTIHNRRRYSRKRTRLLVRLLRQDPNTDLILFNDTRIRGVRRWRGHDNHLHVRFKK